MGKVNMRVLFVGIGLTHYYNQVMNKLSKQPGIELFNLVDANGKGQGAGVYETTDSVEFQVVYCRHIVFKKFSDYYYHGFSSFISLVQEINPEIIVVSEMFAEFIFSKSIYPYIQKMGIKIIMKNIPFRLDTYSAARQKIINGQSDEMYIPWFVLYGIKLLEKVNLKKVASYGGKILHLLKIDKSYRKYIGRNVLLELLEKKKRQYCLCDAHVDYVEEAYPIFESYGVPKEKIFIIYNSPDTDLLFEIRKKIETEQPILPPLAHRLIHVGRLVEWKRVDMLIRSFQTIRMEFLDAELLIIGDGPLEGSLKNLVKQLNLSDSVKFIGGVYKPDELGRYLVASTIYVLAGMGGISINDAMAFGKPIICSVCDGTEKKLVYNGRNGLYFKDGDEKDLTAKITYLFNNFEFLQKMGQTSTEIIKHEINIHIVIKGYLSAFRYVSS